MTEATTTAYRKSPWHSIGIFLLKGISYLPFWCIYLLSDLFAFVLRHVVRYRREVITTNLRNAFPEYSEQEIRKLTGRFYHHFADITLESLKGYSMSRKEFDQRMVFKGVEEMNALAEEGRSVLLLGFHYNNWEWSGNTSTWWCTIRSGGIPSLRSIFWGSGGDGEPRRYLCTSRHGLPWNLTGSSNR